MKLFTVRDLAEYMVPHNSSDDVIAHQVLELESYRLPALWLYKDVMALPEYLTKITDELLSVVVHAIVNFCRLPITDARLNLATKFLLYPNKDNLLRFAGMCDATVDDYLTGIDTEFVDHSELSNLLGVTVIEPAYVMPSVERYQHKVLSTESATDRLALSALLVRHLYEQGVLFSYYADKYTHAVGYRLDSKIYKDDNCLQALAVSVILNSGKFTAAYGDDVLRLTSDGIARMLNGNKAPIDAILLTATQHIAGLINKLKDGSFTPLAHYTQLLEHVVLNGQCTQVNQAKFYGVSEYIALKLDGDSSAVLQIDKSQLQHSALAVRLSDGRYCSVPNWKDNAVPNFSKDKLNAILTELYKHTTTVDEAATAILNYYEPISK